MILESDIAGLQNVDGSFSGDMWGEIDTRYSFPQDPSLFWVHDSFEVSFHMFWKSLTIEFFCRFSYIAICCLSLLQCLDKINVEKAVNYIVSCKNLDGGFGCTPGAESHAGQSMLYILYQSSFMSL